MKRPAINLVLTRPRGGNERVVSGISPALLAQLNIVLSPLIKIKGRPAPMAAGPVTAIFTSQNGVTHGPSGADQAAYCVGENTARAARDAGWRAVSMGRDLSELTRGLSKLRPQRFVHFRGVHTAGSLALELAAAEHHVDDVIVYDQELCDLTPEAKHLITTGVPVIAPLFSPRTARHFAQQTKGSEALMMVALSDAVAAAAQDVNGQMYIAPTPDLVAVIEVVENLVKSPDAG